MSPRTQDHRCVLLVVLTVLAVLACAGSASAALRYASPGGGAGPSAEPCTAPILGHPCSLARAVNNGNANDEVVLLPGTYLTTQTNTLSPQAGMSIHGEAGQPRPQVQIMTAVGGNAISMAPVSGVTISGIDFVFKGGDNADRGIDMGDDTVADTTVVLFDKGLGIHIDVDGGVLRDVGVRTQTGSAIQIQNVSADLEHVTAHGGDFGLIDQGSGSTITATNSIFIGGTEQSVILTGDGLKATFDHDAYATQMLTSAPTLPVIAATHRITAAPIFTDPNTFDDFHEAAGSPTIDQGITGALGGTVDLDGDARLLGAAPDIGADEFRTPATVVTGVPIGVDTTTESLSGTVNSQRSPLSWHFEYGTSVAYGTSTAAVAAIVTNTDQTESTTVTGLAPGTTYHARLVGVDGYGRTVNGADTTFTTLGTAAGSGGGGAGGSGAGAGPGDNANPPPLGAPKLTGLRESARRWRHGAKPVRFSFTLDRAAAVTVTFTRRTTGRRVGKRCVARTRANAHRHACTRTVTAGSLHLTARAGANTLSFKGALSKTRRLRPGSYSASFTATAGGKTSKPSRLQLAIAR